MRKLFLCALLLSVGACKKQTPASGTGTATPAPARAVAHGTQVGAAPFSPGRPPMLATLDTLLLRNGLLNAPGIRAYLAKTSSPQTVSSMSADSLAAMRVAFVRDWMKQHPDSVALLSKHPIGITAPQQAMSARRNAVPPPRP